MMRQNYGWQPRLAMITVAAVAGFNLADGGFIGGGWRAPEGGGKLPLENPSDGSEVGEIARGTSADIDAAVMAAEAALAGEWGRTTAAERGRLMMKMGRMVLERADALARIEASENFPPLARHLLVAAVSGSHARTAANLDRDRILVESTVAKTADTLEQIYLIEEIAPEHLAEPAP